MASPLAQFQIHTLVPLAPGGVDLSLTNSSVFMVVALIFIWGFMVGGMSQARLVPNRWQAAVESIYEFIVSTLFQSVGPGGKPFIPLIFSLFMFILLGNLLGLLPLGLIPGGHAFTITSHLTVTAFLAVISFTTVLVVGFSRHGLHFFSLFVPKGVPGWMLPLIVLVEFVSFLIRPFSLALRLFVAMTAGHILVKVLAAFVVEMGNSGSPLLAAGGLLPMALLIGITALEILVCTIQAYVFALLTAVYLNDAVNLH